MNNNKNFKSNRFQKKQEHKINNLISSNEVRITGENIDSRICSLKEALPIAGRRVCDKNCWFYRR
jgi:translation initiation factor IF-3